MAPASSKLSTEKSRSVPNKFVVGVPLKTLLDSPGTRLKWKDNVESIKVLYATASAYQIACGIHLTSEIINEVMDALKLTYLENFTDARGQSAFENVVSKIMSFYDYNMPRFTPFEMWTEDWTHPDWDGNTNKPQIADESLRQPIKHEMPKGTSKAGHIRNLFREAAELRRAKDPVPIEKVATKKTTKVTGDVPNDTMTHRERHQTPKAAAAGKGKAKTLVEKPRKERQELPSLQDQIARLMKDLETLKAQVPEQVGKANRKIHGKANQGMGNKPSDGRGELRKRLVARQSVLPEECMVGSDESAAEDAEGEDEDSASSSENSTSSESSDESIGYHTD